MAQMLHATEAGTARFRDRFHGKVAPDHFHLKQGLWLSAIGIGTYLGEFDERTDLRYRDSIVRAVELGCNVIDTAINYRFQRSERSIRDALKILFETGKAARDEIIVATKAGFLTFDGQPPGDPMRYFQDSYIAAGIIDPQDVVAGMHCMSPRYIADQLERSRRNLGLECIDIYYLHNPETQLEEVSPEQFNRRLLAAFEVLEQAVAENKIRMYGTATWEGYRAHRGAQNYLSLEEIVKLAETVGGKNHHFKVIQLPFNLAMSEAFTLKNQKLNNEYVSVLEAAERLGIIVMASASILQARLSRNLPAFVREHLRNLQTDAQRAIQFVRSTPGITVALVGMSQIAHVEENLSLAREPLLPEDEYLRLFS